MAGGFAFVNRTVAPGIATYIGAFALPAIFAWWGVILINKNKKDS